MQRTKSEGATPGRVLATLQLPASLRAELDHLVEVISHRPQARPAGLEPGRVTFSRVARLALGQGAAALAVEVGQGSSAAASAALQRQAERAALQACADVLPQLQWAAENGWSSRSCCLLCHRHRSRGHASDCPIGAAFVLLAAADHPPQG